MPERHAHLLEMLIVHLEYRLEILDSVVNEQVLVLADHLWAASRLQEGLYLGVSSLVLLLFEGLHEVRARCLRLGRLAHAFRQR